MAHDTLLEHIWSDALEERSTRDASPISHLLTTLLAAPILSLVDKSPTSMFEPYVGFGGSEILPGASLADVLLQEMGIEIDETTIVLVEASQRAGETRRSTDELGRVIGDILIKLSAMDSEVHATSGPSESLISAASMSGLYHHTSLN